MISLDASKIKTTTTTLDGVTTTKTLDTIWIDYLEMNRQTGTVKVIIKFGTNDADGNLIETDTPIMASVNRDGTFTSDDPKYQGKLDVAAVAGMIKSVLTGFEQAIIDFGWTKGTVA